MDRLPWTFAACGLGLLLTASGCRSTRPEVPPGRQFSSDGKQRKAIEFSSEGHPMSGAATATFTPNTAGGSSLASGIGAGISRPDASSYGVPPGGYGAPGSSGLGQPPTLGPVGSDPAAMPASMAPPVAGLPPAPELDVTPAPSLGPPPVSSAAPSQVILPQLDTPGVMGQPDQLPSPN